MKFVLSTNGFLEAENLKLGIAEPSNPLLSKWDPFYLMSQGWEHVKQDAIASAKEALKVMTDGYYDTISYLYKTMTEWITTVPIDLLSNDNAYKMQGLFMGYSVLMVIFLSIGEGFKALFGINYTKPATIFGRTFIAFIGAGLTMPAVIWLAKCMNIAVQMVLILGEKYLNGTNDLGAVLRDFSGSGTVNFIASLLFMLAFLFFIVKALFKVGIRWFDLLMNLVASPFAWAAYVTDGTSKHLANWLKGTGRLLLINLVYAFYVTVISTIVIAPGAIDSFGGFMGRLLLILGGLWRLSNPPGWIRGMDSNGSVVSVGKSVIRSLGLNKIRKLGGK